MKTLINTLTRAFCVIVTSTALFAQSPAATPDLSIKPQAATTPEQRVQSFLADYVRTHAKHPMKTTTFDTWAAAIRVLNDAHFIGNGGMHLAQSMGDPAQHDPAKEKIISTTVRDGTTFVETRTTDMTLPKYYEYQMRKTGSEWRIAGIDEFLHTESEPLVNAKNRARLMEKKALALRKIPSVESFANNQLFKANRTVRMQGESKQSELQIRDVGLLNVSTGTLVVADFGYGADLFAPLSIRVSPGQYKVQVATAFGRNASVQVLFSDAAVKHWHPADTTTGGHVAGVDAGNIAVFDVAAVLDSSDRNQSRAFSKYAATGKAPHAGFISLTAANDVLIADSGFGDGSYPAYWGLDANGKPVVLVVDFFLSLLEPAT